MGRRNRGAGKEDVRTVFTTLYKKVKKCCLNSSKYEFVSPTISSGENCTGTRGVYRWGEKWEGCEVPAIHWEGRTISDLAGELMGLRAIFLCDKVDYPVAKCG